MRQLGCTLILVTLSLTSASHSTPADERTSKKPGDSDNAEARVVLSPQFSSTFRDLLRMLKSYYEERQKGNLNVSPEQFQAIMTEMAAHYARYTDEFSYALPVYAGLAAVKLAEGNEQKRNKAYAKLGEAFWRAINSDRAVPVLKAFTEAITLGELYLITP
ncbi:uncharacterized protein LOC135383356 [Ornithodoros turicata]|uniref:uncharacterized protein LOC135383356 n=1 Tax=Ornithodoros turicata TaxID=34597 RepID=UPI00313A2F8B